MKKELSTCKICREEKPPAEFHTYFNTQSKTCKSCKGGGAPSRRNMPLPTQFANCKSDWAETMLRLGFMFASDADKSDIAPVDVPRQWSVTFSTFSETYTISDPQHRARLRYRLADTPPALTIVPAVKCEVDYYAHAVKHYAGKLNALIGFVTVAGKVVYRTDIVECAPDTDLQGVETSASRAARAAKYKALQTQCEVYIEKHYPNHANPLAYWGDEAGEN